MRVCILLICSPTLFHNLRNLRLAIGFGLIIAGQRTFDTFWRVSCSMFRIIIVREQRVWLAWCLGCEGVPEVVDCLLRVLLPRKATLRSRRARLLSSGSWRTVYERRGARSLIASRRRCSTWRYSRTIASWYLAGGRPFTSRRSPRTLGKRSIHVYHTAHCEKFTRGDGG
jgi:hypothetical protein